MKQRQVEQRLTQNLTKHQEYKLIQRQEHIRQLNQERTQYLKQKHMRANSLYAQARASFAVARCWPHAKL
jgi:hypothetical protein